MPAVIRVLLAGPLPPPMGGNTRHFATLAEDLGEHPEFAVEVLNTSRGERFRSPLHNLAVGVAVLWRIVMRLRRSDVASYQASDRGMFLFGPLVVLLGRMSGTPVVLRVFGGSFGDFYLRRSRIGRYIVRRFVLSADVVLLQTRRTMKQLEGLAAGQLEWFSTYVRRAAPDADQRERQLAEDDVCNRFVFLGHVATAKGMETMLDAAPDLPAGCTIDVYGPLDEYTAEDIDTRGRGRVRYRGFLTHAEVDRKLWDYDCLVLPTFYPGEGYPGVIAEAFAHGLPVIASNWKAIPEMVDDGCAILVEPRDVAGFVAAVRALFRDRGRWLSMRERALVRAQQFNHAVWSRKFEEICEMLATKGRQ